MFDWINFENPVAIWWVTLSLAGIANIMFWVWTRIFKFSTISFKLLLKTPKAPPNMIWLSMFYVFVCAFRSWFPRADVQRICIWDTWFSSVFLGRSVATIGELAFVYQWAILLQFVGHETADRRVSRIAKIIFPMICVAEVCSWYAVISTNYLGNTIEESLWAITYSLIFVSLILVQRKLLGALRLACQFAALGSFLYVLFMITVDVPMYITRFLKDTATGKVYFGFWEGIVDLNSRWIVTRSISDWQSEIPWQTLYFTFAVLVSIALCYVPLNSGHFKKYYKHA